jgi:hypothetical protein
MKGGVSQSRKSRVPMSTLHFADLLDIWTFHFDVFFPIHGYNSYIHQSDQEAIVKMSVFVKVKK